MSDILLTVELVPRSCFFSNLRSNLKKKDWDTLRHACIHRAGHRCEICGSRGGGYSLECHEIWEYDDAAGVQRLTGLVSLCKACHRVKHMVLARHMGWHLAAERHLMQVNGWNEPEMMEYLDVQFSLFESRSEREWLLDIGWLSHLDVEIPEILDRQKPLDPDTE
jgi:hypothetical protein